MSLIVTANKMNTDGGAATGDDLDNDNTVRNIIMFIDVATGREVRTIDVDNSDSVTDIAYSPLGDYFFATLQGNNELGIFDALTSENDAGLGGFVSRRQAAGAPQAVVADQTSQRVFVKNLTTRNVTVFDLGAFYRTGALVTPSTNITTVASESMAASVRRGKEVFYNAGDRRMSAEGYISCASCHVDGAHDGRVWDFTGRGEGLRNTIDLRGRAGTGHGNVHWSANFDEIQDFEHDIRNAFGGHGFLTDQQFDNANHPLGPAKTGLNVDLDALASYVASLGDSSAPRSPHRESNGSLTPAAQAGQIVFTQQNCNSCHAGNTMTDGRLHNVGTMRATSGRRLSGNLSGLDTPTLRGIWATAPYFHDGAARTLADVFNVVGGTLYPAENATASGAASLVEGSNNSINWDQTTFGQQAMQFNGVGSIIFNNVNGGSGGIGAVEFRYAASFNPGPLVVRVNGTNHTANLTVPYNDPSWRRVNWLNYRIENVQFAAGANNTIVLDLASGGAIAVDHIIVSTSDDLAQAGAHRNVLNLPQTDRDNLVAYLQQLDGSPVNNGSEADPSATITPPTAATLGETLKTDSVSFVIGFSRYVTGLTNSDLSVGGTANAQNVTLIELNPGITYRVDMSGMTQSGTLTLGVVANAVADTGGRTNQAISPVTVNWERFVDDLAPLSDEFDDSSTLANWQRVNTTEGWQADQLRNWSVHTDRTNYMRMEPHTSLWLGDYRAPLAYKLISGDFVATVRLDIRRANGVAGWPTGQYGMGGLLVRAPKTVTTAAPNPNSPASTVLSWPPSGFTTEWSPGQEDWLSIFVGRAWDYAPDQWSCSVASADNSTSGSYQTTAGIPQNTGIVTLQIARVGSTFLLLRRHGEGPWIVEQRFNRPDLPNTLQVGVGASGGFGNLFGNATFYNPSNNTTAFHYNRNVLAETALQGTTPGDYRAPDVSVDADYLRFLRVRENLTEEMLQAIPVTAGNATIRQLSGSVLANILGDHANHNPAAQMVIAPSITTQPSSTVQPAGSSIQLTVVASGTAPLSYQWERNGQPIPNAISPTLALNALIRANSGDYTVIVSNAAGTVTSQTAQLRVLTPQRLLSPVRQAGGQFRLRFGDHDGASMSAADAASLEVWFIEDLTTGTWTRLTNALTADGSHLYLDDPVSTNRARRFYRVIER